LVDEALEHAADRTDGLVHLDVAPLGDGAAREPEELPDEPAAALGRVKDLLELASHLGGGGRESELGIGADDEEEVVEVVGHSAREQADGLHLLRLAHLLPDPALLGDVLEDADRTLGPA